MPNGVTVSLGELSGSTSAPAALGGVLFSDHLLPFALGGNRWGCLLRIAFVEYPSVAAAATHKCVCPLLLP